MKQVLLALLIGLGVFGAVYPAVAAEEPYDEAKAIVAVTAAADAGDAEAQYLIGNFLTENRKDDAKVVRGAAYFEMAAKQGHVLAMHSLANLIRHGYVPGKTPTDAFRWLLKSADAGLAGSQNNLGDMYETGDGVQKSYGDAVHWYTRSAMQGEPTAYLSLGDCYMQGHGVHRNEVEAYRWFVLAVKNFKNAPNNRAKAARAMKELEQTMTPTQIADGLKLADQFVPLKQTANTMTDSLGDK